MLVKNLVIISGASRGLGAAMAQRFAQHDHTLLLTISRSALPWSFEATSPVQHHHIQADLGSIQGTELARTELLERWPASAQRYILINNAGTVAPIAACKNLNDAQALSHAYQLNVLAPMSLCATFLQHSPTHAQRRIVNISSGAGRRAVAGWGVYGSSKAALDYYTQVLQLENPDLRAVSLAPGVIDTDMQTHIRAQDHDNFPDLDRFIDLHQNQQLNTAEHVAQRIIAYLDSPQFGLTTLDDIRHYE